MLAGIGYDVHRFSKKRALILGGVRISKSNGLLGHSDADVIIHALMDSILGAAGLDDIGHFFPNTSSKFKNISSILLLKKVREIVSSKKLKIGNTDISVIAEKPKISRYIPKMKIIIAEALNISPKRIGIKATTNEKLGFIGRGEGIAAFALTVLLKKK